MENNKKLSVIVTTSKDLNITSSKGIGIDHFTINKKDGNEKFAPIDYINFYSQLKYLASN